MPADVEPPELQRLLDFAERARTDDWSLRSALVRYAQPEPERASVVLSLTRRIEWALHQHIDLLRREGVVIFNDLTAGAAPHSGPPGFVIEVLRAVTLLDTLGDELARWAVDRAGDRPNTHVDAVTAEVAHRIDLLGVPAEADPTRQQRASRA